MTRAITIAIRTGAELLGSFLIVGGIVGAHLLAFAEEKPRRPTGDWRVLR